MPIIGNIAKAVIGLVIDAREQISRMIDMHDKNNQESIVGKTFDGCIFEDYPFGHNLGGAGLVSTLSDYANFAIILLNNGRFDEKQLISEETLKLLYQPFVKIEKFPGKYNRGLGVRVVTKSEKNILPSDSYGWSGAYGSHFWIDPQNNICAVYMKNSRVDGGAGNFSACLFEEAVYNSFD